MFVGTRDVILQTSKQNGIQVSDLYVVYGEILKAWRIVSLADLLMLLPPE